MRIDNVDDAENRGRTEGLEREVECTPDGTLPLHRLSSGSFMDASPCPASPLGLGRYSTSFFASVIFLSLMPLICLLDHRRQLFHLILGLLFRVVEVRFYCTWSPPDADFLFINEDDQLDSRRDKFTTRLLHRTTALCYHCRPPCLGISDINVLRALDPIWGPRTHHDGKKAHISRNHALPYHPSYSPSNLLSLAQNTWKTR